MFGLCSRLIVGRPLDCGIALISSFCLRRDLSGERFANGFQQFQLLLLLVDGLVEFFELVFLEGELGFDFFEALFSHGLICRF